MPDEVETFEEWGPLQEDTRYEELEEGEGSVEVEGGERPVEGEYEKLNVYERPHVMIHEEAPVSSTNSLLERLEEKYEEVDLMPLAEGVEPTSFVKEGGEECLISAYIVVDNEVEIEVDYDDSHHPDLLTIRAETEHNE